MFNNRSIRKTWLQITDELIKLASNLSLLGELATCKLKKMFIIIIIKFNPNICCITEIWATEIEASSFAYNNFTSFYKCRAAKRGGGIMILIHPSFNPVQCGTATGNDAMSLTIKFNGMHRLLSLIYRAPNASEDENQTKLIHLYGARMTHPTCHGCYLVT